MVVNLPEKNDSSPYKSLEGQRVSYHTSQGVIMGIYHEGRDTQTGNYWMEFKPSLVQDVDGHASVESNLPTISTNFGGIMRPLPKEKSLEDIASEINNQGSKKG